MPNNHREIEAKFDPSSTSLSMTQLESTTSEHPRPHSPLSYPRALPSTAPLNKHLFHRNLAAGCTPRPWTNFSKRSAAEIKSTLSDLPTQRSIYGYELHYHLSTIALNKQTTQPQTRAHGPPQPTTLGGEPGPQSEGTRGSANR
jgi:hypothetical protein